MELRCVGGRAGASGHVGTVLEHGPGADAGMRADTDTGTHDAVAQHGSGADRNALPENGTLHGGPRSHDTALTQDSGRPNAGVVFESAACADDDGRGRSDAGAEDGVAGNRAPLAASVCGSPDGPRGGQIGLDTAGQQIEMSLPVLCRANG